MRVGISGAGMEAPAKGDAAWRSRRRNLGSDGFDSGGVAQAGWAWTEQALSENGIDGGFVVVAWLTSSLPSLVPLFFSFSLIGPSSLSISPLFFSVPVFSLTQGCSAGGRDSTTVSGWACSSRLCLMGIAAERNSDAGVVVFSSPCR
ncbi:hypothetical protein M0R45_006334 [Rubus argutus]|uniref:Uncharacterized protein n=1 Tax=Rubus argutus TaxID=59490 RepID=A0AAW1YQ78_RUBAR